jgi:hypothetical protein
MAFEWLDRFHRETEKDPGYAERTLAAYRLGMKAKGSITGVRVVTGPGCCALAAGLDPARVHDPAAAPRLPLAGCPRGRRCTCVYRPVMSYAPEGR